MHQIPCRVCGSKATLYDTGGIKNLKLMETLKNHLKVSKICPGLFESSLEVQLRRESLYEELFPKQSNKARLYAAFEQTRAMLRKHMRKAPWAVSQAGKTVAQELREAKIRRVSSEELKVILERENLKFPRIQFE